MLSLESNGFVHFVVHNILKMNFIYCLFVLFMATFAINIIFQSVMSLIYVGIRLKFNYLFNRIILNLLQIF